MPDDHTDEKPEKVTPVVADEPTSAPEAHAESTPAPVATPAPTAPAAAAPHNTAGTLVLQWLTYAFWGWLIIALIWTTVIILLNAILDIDVSSVTPYTVAAGIVILPLAFVTDLFYRKHEPAKKVGAAAVIMIIHAVIFALLAIGALITAVFIGLNIAMQTSGSFDNQMVILWTTLIATVLYGTAFLRTLNPFKNKKPTFFYGIGMLAVTILLLVLAIAGPFAKGIATRSDRLIESSLPAVADSIGDYIRENNELPNTLNDVEYSTDEAEKLVADNLVTYKKEETVTDSSVSYARKNYRYQLCVTYTGVSNNSYSSRGEKGYTSYLYISGHKAGDVCYKLQTTINDYDLDKFVD